MKFASLEAKLLHKRRTNIRGVVIPLHHAFKKIRHGRVSRLALVVLPVFFTALLWVFLPLLASLWEEIFRFWLGGLGVDGHIAYRDLLLFGQHIAMPFPDMSAPFPSSGLVWINLSAVIAGIGLSLLLPDSLSPLTYFLRAALVIHGSAAVYFLINPYSFPYDLSGYIANSLSVGLTMLFLVPALLGTVYYVFHFPLWQKCLLTLMVIGFFAIALPHQYLVHAYVIHRTSLLYLPLFYFLFGTLLNVFVLICFYALGMSWGSGAVNEVEKKAF
jgi:hypothetical protein